MGAGSGGGCWLVLLLLLYCYWSLEELGFVGLRGEGEVRRGWDEMRSTGGSRVIVCFVVNDGIKGVGYECGCECVGRSTFV